MCDMLQRVGNPENIDNLKNLAYLNPRSARGSEPLSTNTDCMRRPYSSHWA